MNVTPSPAQFSSPYDYSYDYMNYYEINSTNATPPRDEIQSFILPVWRQVLWSILYAGMVIVATGGNLIVIWIVLAHKRMRTVTNYFLLNLSVADTMVSTLNVTFSFVYMLNSHWPFGKLYCKISQFIAVLSICASVFSLMAISIDRYMAIMTPLRPRMGKTVTLCVAFSIWVLSIIISSPYLMFYTVDRIDEGDRIVCYIHWPDGPANESMLDYIYNVAFLFVTYVVPIGSMTYTYARIGIELWGSQSIGECTQRQMENIKNKRRVVKMMMVVVIIFAVCWLPFDLYFIVTSYFPEITKSPYIQETYLAIYWLAMSNSMYNPMIYCWMNASDKMAIEDAFAEEWAPSPEAGVPPLAGVIPGPVRPGEESAATPRRFRRGFKQFFSWLPYVHVSPGPLTRRGVFTSGRRSYSGSPDHNRIMRNGTVRTQLYNACQNPTSSDTYYTNVQDEFGYPKTSKRWKSTEMKQLS